MDWLNRIRERVNPTPPGGFNAWGVPVVKADARTYVAHGDIQWGNAITTRVIDDHNLSVFGWLDRAPFPEPGDKLLVKMESGKWGVFIFTESERARDPKDMFSARASGAIEYHDAPKTKSPDEFIENLSPFFRT
jgi:hypothetical protein